MDLGYENTLYILAFDHRGSFQKMFGISGRQPTPEENEKISDAKMLIFEGMQKALAGGVSRESAGLLTDEQYGADVARKAKADGLTIAMPVEKSGQDEFDFDHGEEFGSHIEDFDPYFTKVLVRYNPQGDADMNQRQTERLRRLSDWLHDKGRKFLFELLVPAEKAQLEKVGGDEGRYDTELRPALMMRAIETLQDEGVEADVWKIEGIDSRSECTQIAELVHRGGRDKVGCVVLGRGADDARVDAWLRAGSGVPGYIGFAIGRSIFGEAIKGTVAGTLDREAASQSVAEKYQRFIKVYETG